MKVEETRDLLMQELIPGIKVTLKVIASLEVKELYYDWSLHNRSGILVGVLENEEDEDNALENYTEKEAVHKDIMRISRQAEKLPEFVDSCFLNERTLLVIRTGILVRIEKELIKTGFEEHLKLTKRQLEKGLLHAGDFENILQKSVVDIFVDWDFKLDKSYIIFILQPNNN